MVHVWYESVVCVGGDVDTVMGTDGEVVAAVLVAVHVQQLVDVHLHFLRRAPSPSAVLLQHTHTHVSTALSLSYK